MGFITADLERGEGGTAWLSEVSQPVAAALRCRVSRAAAGSLLLFLTFSKCPSLSREQRTRDCKARLSWPDSPDLSGYWLSQASAGALEGGGKSNLKILVCLMGINTAPKASTAVIRASEGFRISEYNW